MISGVIFISVRLSAIKRKNVDSGKLSKRLFPKAKKANGCFAEKISANPADNDNATDTENNTATDSDIVIVNDICQNGEHMGSPLSVLI